MKKLLITSLLSILSVAASPADDQTISAQPSSGAIASGKRIVVSFPTAMVDKEKIDAAKQPSPIKLSPAVTTEFVWKSQTEGHLRITESLPPRTTYSLSLNDGLQDLDGSAVVSTAPLAKYLTTDLTVKINWRRAIEAVDSQPIARLLFNYPVTFDSATRGIYFQDRDTGEKFPADLILPNVSGRAEEVAASAPQPTSGTDFQVTPSKPLPVERTIDLIVDGVRSKIGNIPLLVLESKPIGNTSHLKVTGARGYHNALTDPSVTIYFNQPVEIDSVNENSVRVEPEVPGLARQPGSRSITLTGEFDVDQTYTIRVDAPLVARSGYPLPGQQVSEVKFNGNYPAVYFPSTQFFQRSGLGLNVKFLHANTGDVTWKLAQIPPHRLSAVWKRAQEYEEWKIDPLTGHEVTNEETGWVETVDTELLVDALKLKTLGTGKLPGTDSTEPVFRDIRWKPEGGAIPAGAYLLEVNAPTKEGRVAGNRAVIFFNDIYVTQKRTPRDLILKLSKMGDSDAVPGALVKVVSEDNQLLAEDTSDAHGMVRFPRVNIRPKKKGDPTPHHFVIDSPMGKAVQFVEMPYYYDSGYAGYRVEEEKESPVTTIFTDRNLYRPGHTVKFKGITRVRTGDGIDELEVRGGLELNWKITAGGSRIVASGSTKLDEVGGWEGEWNVPTSSKLGSYAIHCSIPGLSTKHGYAGFRVEEYRVPLFEVELADESQIGDTARIRVQSNYFHGGANVGARVSWTAHWSPQYYGHHHDFRRGDRYSEKPRRAESLPEMTGELKLDEDGSGYIDIQIPASTPYAAARYGVQVSLDVVSPEGRTISTGIYGNLQVVPHDSGLRMEVGYDPDPHFLVEVGAFDRENKPAIGIPAEVTVYLVEAKTVKEKVSPGVFRYRNFKEFTEIRKQKTKTGEVLNVPAEKPGRYVAVARLRNDPASPQLSSRVTVAGEKPASYPVYNSSAFMVKSDKDRYQPGDTAKLAIEAPFGGKAWVSIETDDIIDQFVVDVASNAGGIDLPVKPEYYPNAFVSIYLVKPGGPDHLPKERYGRFALTVDRADLKLDVRPTLTKTEVEPGQLVEGEILVASLGNPVANADLTLMAVDEAVLRLGNWSLPDFEHSYFPYRSHRVATYQALSNHFEEFDESMVTEKGFLIGGGGLGFGGQKRTRTNFVARAFWKTRLKTDKDGMAKFSFPAPDNLTAFRITAVANTAQSQFGEGSTLLRVNKRLMIEPAMPRFIRRGDELELRAVVRQGVRDGAAVKLTCSLDGAIGWAQDIHDLEQVTDKDIPSVFRFKGMANRTENFAKVRFDAVLADNPEVSDSVELTIPVYAAGVTQRTSRYGEIPQDTLEFKLGEHVPEMWKENDGDVDLTLSHSPWLPKLLGLPEILDYPHGCLEQKSSRYLGYTELASLMDYLPDLKDRHANYEMQILQGLREYEQALLPNGFLPYWPGGDEVNAHVTVMAAWVLQNAKTAGFEVPEKLDKALPKVLADIVHGRVNVVNADTRCFAAYVQSLAEGVEAPQDILENLYRDRAKLREDALAFLALSMVNYDIMGVEQDQLSSELSRPIKERAFDPNTFWSPGRSEAIRFLAMTKIGDEKWRKGEGENARQRMLKMMDDSRGLSTQENLWMLLAFRAMHDAQEFAPLEKVEGDTRSENGVSVAWKTQALRAIGDLSIKLGSSKPVFYVADARVVRKGEDMKREDLGFRIERVTKNLTEPERTGSADKPFKLGDEVLITYRVNSKRQHYYAALTDELPAGLETVNFNLAQVSEFYELPDEAGKSTLRLNHSELRDQQANLYFNRVAAGNHTYSILARATSAGKFTWPSSQISPMYEARFSGLGAADELHVSQ